MSLNTRMGSGVIKLSEQLGNESTRICIFWKTEDTPISQDYGSDLDDEVCARRCFQLKAISPSLLPYATGSAMHCINHSGSVALDQLLLWHIFKPTRYCWCSFLALLAMPWPGKLTSSFTMSFSSNQADLLRHLRGYVYPNIPNRHASEYIIIQMQWKLRNCK